MPPTPKLQNLDLASNMRLLGSGRGLKRRGAPVGAVLAKFQLKWRHGNPFRDQNNVFVQPALTSDYLVLTSDYLVVTSDSLVMPSDSVVVTSTDLVVTSAYFVVWY